MEFPENQESVTETSLYFDQNFLETSLDFDQTSEESGKPVKDPSQEDNNTENSNHGEHFNDDHDSSFGESCSESSNEDCSSSSHSESSEDQHPHSPTEEQEHNDSYTGDDRDYSGDDRNYISDDDDYTSDIPFQCTYNCHPITQTGKSHLEQGDQIIMPASAIENLLKLRISHPWFFEIQNESKERVSHCGVFEFTAEEGSVLLPQWMMENLKLQEGELVSLKSSSLETGTYIKLQPHSMNFLSSILNPKRVLEEALSSKFFCLTTGDTIKINHSNQNFYIDVVETKPSLAICIIDTDCEVDFALPLDYKEPKRPAEPANEHTSKEPKFMPFTGFARQLILSGSSPTQEVMATESDIRQLVHTGKFVFSSPKHQNRSKEPEKEDPNVESPKKELV